MIAVFGIGLSSTYGNTSASIYENGVWIGFVSTRITPDGYLVFENTSPRRISVTIDLHDDNTNRTVRRGLRFEVPANTGQRGHSVGRQVVPRDGHRTVTGFRAFVTGVRVL